MDLGCFSRRVLLTGAGFSKNFGGKLASEFMTILLLQTAVKASLEISRALKSDGNFERTLARARRGEFGTEGQAILEASVMAVFRLMDDRYFDVGRDRRSEFDVYQFQDFLCRFRGGQDNDTTYYFTTNQDLGLERKAYNWSMPPFFCPSPVHPGVPFPLGVTNGGGPYFSSVMGPFDEGYVSVLPREVQDRRLRGRTNYIKLHGAFNWVSKESGAIMVIGEDKADQIAASDLFRWYLETFDAVLMAGGVRLFVIGYSFSDGHLNAVIQRAVREADLTLFVLDPYALDSVRKLGDQDLEDASTPLPYPNLGELMPPSQARTEEWTLICDQFFGS